MSKDNDPRHDIAMAIHHVAGLAENWRVALTKSNGDNGFFISIANHQIEELEAAKSWLKEAQRKVNATPDEPAIHPNPEWQNDAGEPLYNPRAEWKGAETDAHNDYLDR